MCFNYGPSGLLGCISQGHVATFLKIILDLQPDRTLPFQMKHLQELHVHLVLNSTFQITMTLNTDLPIHEPEITMCNLCPFKIRTSAKEALSMPPPAAKHLYSGFSFIVQVDQIKH